MQFNLSPSCGQMKILESRAYAAAPVKPELQHPRSKKGCATWPQPLPCTGSHLPTMITDTPASHYYQNR
jgi:hypothetical protein